ncbi:MAG: dual specificity protein phosphatase family protein [Bryobacterales bacterium]|nr:dual specificity protein phosphatase family protein [Bryobacteraceae bacterium]MDW8130715.1 dual specificity protein phosphatase family protein [Bryobacterales bacterium]
MGLSYDEIVPGLLVGSCPDNPAEVLEIKRAGATALLSLQTDEDVAERGYAWSDVEHWCRQAEILPVREPVRDFDPEHLSERIPGCARTLDRLLADGHTVYLHCTAGVQRSPSVAIAWLVWRRGLSFEQAYALVTQRRYCQPNPDPIRAALRANPVL